jgi:hypothetical protein
MHATHRTDLAGAVLHAHGLRSDCRPSLINCAKLCTRELSLINCAKLCTRELGRLDGVTACIGIAGATPLASSKQNPR